MAFPLYDRDRYPICFSLTQRQNVHQPQLIYADESTRTSTPIWQTTRSIQSVASPHYLLILAGFVLLQGLGYRIYVRQRKTIQTLNQQNNNLLEQIRQLKLSDRQKVSLFSLISHDLRSPVAQLKQRLYALKMTMPATESAREKLHHIEGQVDQLSRLLLNLLDWSAIQMQGLQTNPQPVNLSTIIAGVIADLHDQLSHKQIRLINQVSDSTWIIADRYQLICIVRNLINNAIKFTPSHGYVKLFTSAVDEACTAFIIRDTGIGMDAEQLARLASDPVIRSGTQGEPSTGLGLQLCREFLSGNPDALRITSQSGKGTTVTLQLVTANKPVH